jgi:hypothetical protein
MTRTRTILASVGKGLLAGIVWQIGLIAGVTVTPLLGFKTPPVPPGVDPALILPLGILVGVPVAIALGELSRRLQQPFLPRVLTTFTFHYLVYGLLQVLEQVLFTTTVSLGYGAVSSLFPAAALSLVVGVLWRPEATDRTLRQAGPRFFSARRPADWVWRLIVAWLIYLPIYRGVGLLTSPIVKPLYEAQAFGLVLPEAGAMVDMQYLRGALYLFAVLPIIVLWGGSRRALWLWTGLAIFIQIAATPILLAYWFPLSFRLIHAFELAIDSFAQAYIYARLLYVGDGQEGSHSPA